MMRENQAKLVKHHRSAGMDAELAETESQGTKRILASRCQWRQEHTLNWIVEKIS